MPTHGRFWSTTAMAPHKPKAGLIIHAGFLRTQRESVHEVFSHVPSCGARGRSSRPQVLHTDLGGATCCSPRLRVFVPHDFGFQPIRIAEEDAQGSAEIGNGAIRGA